MYEEVNELNIEKPLMKEDLDLDEVENLKNMFPEEYIKYFNSESLNSYS